MLGCHTNPMRHTDFHPASADPSRLGSVGETLESWRGVKRLTTIEPNFSMDHNELLKDDLGA